MLKPVKTLTGANFCHQSWYNKDDEVASSPDVRLRVSWSLLADLLFKAHCTTCFTFWANSISRWTRDHIINELINSCMPVFV